MEFHKTSKNRPIFDRTQFLVEDGVTRMFTRVERICYVDATTYQLIRILDESDHFQPDPEGYIRQQVWILKEFEIDS